MGATEDWAWKVEWRPRGIRNPVRYGMGCTIYEVRAYLHASSPY